MTPTSQPRVEPDFEEARKIAEKVLVSTHSAREFHPATRSSVAYTMGYDSTRQMGKLATAYLALLARAEAAEERERELREGLEQVREWSVHVRGCDEPDDWSCPRCIADSEIARHDEVKDSEPVRGESPLAGSYAGDAEVVRGTGSENHLVLLPEKYWAKGTSGTSFDPETLRAFCEMHLRHGFDHDVNVKAGTVLYLLDALAEHHPEAGAQ